MAATPGNFIMFIDDVKNLYRVVGTCDDVNEVAPMAERLASEAPKGGPVYVFSLYGKVQQRVTHDWTMPEGIDHPPPTIEEIQAEPDLRMHMDGR